MKEKPRHVQPGDADALNALRVKFELTCDALADDLCAIVEWLADGAKSPRPVLVDFAFVNAPDRMNDCRDLLGRIEDITARGERGKA